MQYDTALRSLQENGNYTVVDVTLEVLEAARRLRGATEIFDRLIAATAIVYHAKLITRDETLTKLGAVETIW